MSATTERSPYDRAWLEAVMTKRLEPATKCIRNNPEDCGERGRCRECPEPHPPQEQSK